MLSIRLGSLVKYVKYNDKIIDIGCDHALLDIYLVKHNVVKKMIVSDVKETALEQGIQNIEKEGLTSRIDARCGNGLEVLTKKDIVDTIIISGMGTSTILEILSSPKLSKINKLIIQSNNDHTLLREGILKLGFYITHEEYFVDNDKNYINIVFARGKSTKLTKNELRYGPILIKNRNYLKFELANCEKIYNLIPKNKLKIRLELKNEMRLINKLIDECDRV
jgi:tRNA (adenine22-N1)-methyltransferase